MKKFVVMSKTPKSEPSMAFNVGKNVLISFASIPLFSSFYWLKKRKEKLPTYYDKETAEYAKRKYCPDYEIVPYEKALEEFEAYEYGREKSDTLQTS